MSEIEAHARKGNNAIAFDNFRLQEGGLSIWIRGGVNRLKIRSEASAYECLSGKCAGRGRQMKFFIQKLALALTGTASFL
jgi:hypothetical protein